MNVPSAIDFPGQNRIHIALAVGDLEGSLEFYERLFGVPPTKVRADYAKFEPADPSVNLTLNRVPQGKRGGAGVSHFGVQVKSTDAVREAAARLAEAGPTRVDKNVTCCYAVQDKVWATDPDGNRWEVFVVTEAEAVQASACCDAAPESAAGVCC